MAAIKVGYPLVSLIEKESRYFHRTVQLRDMVHFGGCPSDIFALVQQTAYCLGNFEMPRPRIIHQPDSFVRAWWVISDDNDVTMFLPRHDISSYDDALILLGDYLHVMTATPKKSRRKIKRDPVHTPLDGISQDLMLARIFRAILRSGSVDVMRDSA